MESTKIAIDPVLVTYVAQTLGRVPENLYDFQVCSVTEGCREGSKLIIQEDFTG